MSENAQTVERAARLLFVLAEHPEGAGVSELARMLDTQRAPLYRILRALEQYRLIHRNDRRRYVLGIGILELARDVAEPLEERVAPLLQVAADRAGQTVMLVIDQADDIVTLLSVTPRSPGMHLTTNPGFVHPPGDSAPRRAIAALHAPTDEDSTEIIEARERGYATTEGAVVPGRVATAVGVFVGTDRRPGAVMIVSPSFDPDYVGICQEAARRVGQVFQAHER